MHCSHLLQALRIAGRDARSSAIPAVQLASSWRQSLGLSHRANAVARGEPKCDMEAHVNSGTLSLHLSLCSAANGARVRQKKTNDEPKKKGQAKQSRPFLASCRFQSATPFAPHHAALLSQDRVQLQWCFKVVPSFVASGDFALDSSARRTTVSMSQTSARSGSDAAKASPQAKPIDMSNIIQSVGRRHAR